MSMFNDISCDRVKVFARRFGIGQWSFIGPGSEKKWYSAEEKSPQGAWDHIADEMLLEFAENGHPIFVQRLHCAGIYSRAKDIENCHYFTAEYPTNETVFRTNIYANQLSIYGAAARSIG